MSFRKRLLVLLFLLLLLAALDALLAPYLVARGTRLWLQWAARQEGLEAQMDQVEAPFLKPVTIRNLRILSPPESSRQVSLQAAAVVVDLNFRGRIFSRRSAFLRSIQIVQLKGKIQTAAGKNRPAKLDWRQFARLIPDNFQIDRADLILRTPDVAIGLGDLRLSASAIESGRFSARRIAVHSPLFRQTFHDLRGATSWENAHLTVAGIPFVRGLDLDTVTLDFSRLKKRKIGVDLQLDAYGGTLRASLQGKAGEKFMIEAAGSAANISLPQLASALGFLEPISGRVRAAKFTFRGHPGQLVDATASVWMELSSFAWREHRADSVMLGATYYDRRLDLEQLYVRQRENQLTINGELLWPKKDKSWMHLPFRGQISATIPDLNSFAQLFGATTGDFTGALIAEGKLDSLASEAQGGIKLRGKGISFRGVSLDSLGASLGLHGSEVDLDSLEARHANDFLRAEGNIDLETPHRFAGRLTGAINDLADYAPLLPASWRKSKIGGGATFDWRADGTLAAHSGTLQLYAHELQLPVTPLRTPLDITLEGSYSPQDLFFRTFQIGNDRVWLGGFLMLGTNFIDFQSAQLTLDGAPRVTGTAFLPISANRWRLSRSLVAALDDAQKFDIDLAASHLDLGALTKALGEKFPVDGVLDGKLSAFGPIAGLQVLFDGNLQHFGGGGPDDLIRFHGHYAENRVDADATATFGSSDPLTLSLSMPLRIEKKSLAAGKVLNRDAPFSFRVNCPGLFLEDLPDELRWGAASGLLSGAVTFSETLTAPKIAGEGQIINGQFKPPSPWPELDEVAAKIQFKNHALVMQPFRCQIGGQPLGLSLSLTTAPPHFRLRVEPFGEGLELANIPSTACNLSNLRVLGEGTPGGGARLRSAVIQGTLPFSVASVTIDSELIESDYPVPQQTTFFVWPRSMRGEPLLLRTLPQPEISLGELSAPQTRSR